MKKYPCILTIAGSDSGGGAGIQADLKTMTVLGGYGMSVITALTAQNGLGVTGIQASDPAFVTLQIKTVLDGFPVAAAKTGMLFSEEIIHAVKLGIHDRRFPLIVDPVSVSQTGHRLLEESAIDALRSEMLPEADLLTPNKPEAEELSGVAINSLDDLTRAARKLLHFGARAVLIKGGHFKGEDKAEEYELTDWLAMPDLPLLPISHPRVDTTNNHGTGCTLSAAIATRIGLGDGLTEAIRNAQSYLNTCLEASYAPGHGVGPVNHAAPFFERD